MSKKSSKTSHVLNLLTSRTGAVIDGEAENEREQSQTASPAGGDSSGKAAGGSVSPGSGSGGTLSDAVVSAASAGGSSGSLSDAVVGAASAGGSPGSLSDAVVSAASAGGSGGPTSFSHEVSSGASSEKTGQPGAALVEIAAPIRVAIANPIIAELTGENALSRSASQASAEASRQNSEEGIEKKEQSVADLIQAELERNYQRERQTPPQESQSAAAEGPNSPQGAAIASSEGKPLPKRAEGLSETKQSLSEEGQLPPEEKRTPTDNGQLPPEEMQIPTEEKAAPPHIEVFTPDQFGEPEETEPTEGFRRTEAAEGFAESKGLGGTEAAEGFAESKGLGGTEAAEEAAESKGLGGTEAAAAPKEEDTFLPYYVNVMDEIVRSNMIPIMESLEMCTCSRCVSDVAALSLNLLPPKYVVTEKGSLYAKVSLYEGQHKVDVLASITKACLAVKNNPRHHC